MTISVIGTGYLGAVHAACMAHLGHRVIAVDSDEAKIEALAAGKPAIFEPGLDELLADVLPTGRLTFTTDYAQVAEAQVHFVCVGTPQLAGENAADTTYVFSAGRSLAPYLDEGSLVVGKSTVPVGTAAALKRTLQDGAPAGVEVRLAWNPEFLREGFAIEDTVTPDRFVYGVEGSHADDDVALLDQVYERPLSTGTPRLVMDYPTAELVKVAANAFLATKISFINAMSEVCEAAGGDVVRLAEAIGHDDRIGSRFLGAGVGFGGGCLPKDIRAFMARAGELGADQALTFLREVDSINLRRRARMIDLAREECGGTLAGRTVAVLGAAFKPNSDDIRDSPALDVAEMARAAGAEVRVHDPKALPVARKHRADLTYADTVEEAVAGAHVVLHLTEWQDYRDLDPARLTPLVRKPAVIDGRNKLDPARWRAAGWTYRALGRPHA
ncbi:UDP-glucose/GDP-mannose dehydrogenase family protein [Luteipulveratus sp. YIM 133132]|uniref:UDP-glucose dehydrogenase family protein n=1 Tax=Luteipulveratus flavus TaxID=3031728 RepID=UPI0023B05680|nr:UDP-glucose/GDP-mannose dehydrogenase family protein [Luteipulveratus sp. YIM 133132]MDE9365898.1 UDP-glucose/GDP-mannose dehydrogenase family protein [Luteipulveratus sp. YIM 133132]